MASRFKRSVPVTVNDVLDGHAGLDLQCLDRLYLHGYLGQLQVGGQVIQFLNHRGYPVPSPACLQQIGDAFRRKVASFAEANHIPVVPLKAADRNIEVMQPYLDAAASAGRSQVAAIGVAQEPQRVFIARKRDTDPGKCPQFSFDKKDRRVTVYYFYLWDAGFGPVGVQVDPCGGRAFVAHPEGDDGDVDACVQQVHRRGVPQGVRGDVLGLQRTGRSCAAVAACLVTRCSTASRRERGSARVANSGLGSVPPRFGEPGGEDVRRWRGERRRAVLAALAVAVACGPVPRSTSCTARPVSSETRSPVWAATDQQGVVAAAVPGGAVRCGEQRVESRRGSGSRRSVVVVACGWIASTRRDQGRVLGGVQGRVAEQRADRGQPRVAGGDAVSAGGFQVAEERADRGGRPGRRGPAGRAPCRLLVDDGRAAAVKVSR